jgi:hypothetical protein
MLRDNTEIIRMSSKLEQIAVRLEPELRAKLQLAADEDQRPLAGLIRKILRDHTSRSQPHRQTGVAA